MALVAMCNVFTKTLLLWHEIESVCHRPRTLSFYVICSSQTTFFCLDYQATSSERKFPIINDCPCPRLLVKHISKGI